MTLPNFPTPNLAIGDILSQTSKPANSSSFYSSYKDYCLSKHFHKGRHADDKMSKMPQNFENISKLLNFYYIWIPTTSGSY